MEQSGSSKNQDKLDIKLPNPNEIQELSEEFLEEKSDDEIYEEASIVEKIKMEITVPEFKKYLEDRGALVAINESLTALCNADPKPVFPRHFFRNQVGMFCNAPSDPMMELIEARYKIEQLEKEKEELREKWAARIQSKGKKRKNN